MGWPMGSSAWRLQTTLRQLFVGDCPARGHAFCIRQQCECPVRLFLIPKCHARVIVPAGHLSIIVSLVLYLGLA
jgi:hypothetical protein